MNNKMLKGRVEAGAIKAVSIIANGSVVHAEVITLRGEKRRGRVAGPVRTITAFISRYLCS